MKFGKKYLFFLFLFAFLVMFMPLTKAHAAWYLGYAYEDAKVTLGTYNSFNEAKAVITANKLTSTLEKTLFISNNNLVMWADYATVKMDRPKSNGYNRVNGDGDIIVYANANLTGRQTGMAGAWATDAVFIDYNPTYNTIKIKLSGVTGWIKADDRYIVPISENYGASDRLGNGGYGKTNNLPKLLINAGDGIKVRTEPVINTTTEISGAVVHKGERYTFYPSKTVEQNGYKWYYIDYNGTKGYVATQSGWATEERSFIYDSVYFVQNNILRHHAHEGPSHYEAWQYLGEAPFYYPEAGRKVYFLNNNPKAVNNDVDILIAYRYYSFDGIYFYKDFKTLVDDYRAGNYNNAVNAGHPYFSYFQYLPSRAPRHRSDASLIPTMNAQIAAKFTSGLTHERSYYYDIPTGTLLHDPGRESVIYGHADWFVDVASKYGVDPAKVLAAALTESGGGNDRLAIAKNNLFGYGASGQGDTAYQNAKTYNSVKDSIDEYTANLGGNTGYSNIYDWRYRGTHPGNKNSGYKVNYATDPYAGETDTTNAFLNDLNTGRVEENKNTLGIAQNPFTKIYKEPDTTKGVIYETKNYGSGEGLYDMPFIVFDEVEVNGQKFYKVYTDVTLNSNRVIDNTVIYSFSNCYGYIREQDLYVWNKQPELNVSDMEFTQGTDIDLLKGVTAIDYEDGDITSRISLDDSYVNTNRVGEYQATYTVKDNNDFSVSKTVTITIRPTHYPQIYFSDLELGEGQSYDPKEGVTVIDNYFGDLTDRLEVVSNNVNINKIGDYTITYSVTNDDEITATRERTVHVRENAEPVITGENVTVYVDDQINLIDYIRATDREDGNLINSVTTSGTVNTAVVGDYNVTYSVSDSYGHSVSKTIKFSVVEKNFINKDSIFGLTKLEYNPATKLLDIEGHLIIKNMNNKKDSNIKDAMILENEETKAVYVRNISRLTENTPYDIKIDSKYDYTGAWFKDGIDLSSVPEGNYIVYIRSRMGDYEAKVELTDHNYVRKTSKFEVDGRGYRLRVNYYKKAMPIELFIRDNGLISKVDPPTSDNMYNALATIEFKDDKLHIQAVSHSIKADYSENTLIERNLVFENVKTNELYLNTNVGATSKGLYTVTLRVPDGYSKLRAWYDTSIDISTLPKGTYAIIVHTKTDKVDDYGELDNIFNDVNITKTIGDKKYTIKMNREKRFRIELTVE